MTAKLQESAQAKCFCYMKKFMLYKMPVVLDKLFLKEYMCKHVLGIAIRLKVFQVCLEAKNIPIGQKRKRGRPPLS